MRREYSEFQKRDTEILNLGPDSKKAFREYWQEHQMPFPGLADPKHIAAKAYGQSVRLLKLGRLPLQVIVDREGIIQHRYDGSSMQDIPSNADTLRILDAL